MGYALIFKKTVAQKHTTNAASQSVYVWPQLD